MTKKALCIGINDYPIEGADLKGCVNDANAWAQLLTDHFDFPAADVKVLVDAEAIKANIVSGLKDHLLAGADYGDVLVFTNSSHGSYIADTSGDEPTYDETMCPYDILESPLVDDELRELFADLPRGVHLTIISDSCHSGTVTRALVADNIPGLTPPDDRRVRFLNPALRGDPVLTNPLKAKPRRYMVYPQDSMKEVLLTGCLDSEYSYDALIEGGFHGAMTFHAIRALQEADYHMTYQELHERLGKLLEQAGYPQHPQLEGRSYKKDRQVFT